MLPDRGRQDSEIISGYAKRVAEELARAVPGGITARMAKQLRPGKVFIDWSQNAAFKTTVAPYSLRAQASPTASAPLTWDEVESFATGASAVHQLSPSEVLTRLEADGDLLAGLLSPGPEVPTR